MVSVVMGGLRVRLPTLSMGDLLYNVDMRAINAFLVGTGTTSLNN